MYMKLLLTSFLMLFMTVLPASAQRVVTGTVTDTKGETLIGVSVYVKNGKHRTVTDMEGQFKIQIDSEDAVLLFRYVGMEPYQTAVKGQKALQVTMNEMSTQLAEAVVISTGYQKLSRERSTAAFGFVDSTKLNRVMHKDIQSALEGQVAGLTMSINPNTGESSPILRGIGTFSNEVGSTPLIVVDDMATDLKLSDINPYNVESITVLKDAAAASIYGALAANGVIVVTTKQGKSEKTTVNVNADWYISTKPKFDNMHYASTSDIIDYETEVYNNRVANKGSVALMFSELKNNYYSPLYQLYRDRDEGRIMADEVSRTLDQWRHNDYYEQFRENVWRTALTQKYNVSLSQKGKSGNHFASFNYQHDKNRIKNDRANAFSLYYKSTFKLTKWLDIKLGIDARLSKSTSPEGLYTQYTIQERYASILDANGNYVYSPNVNIGGYVGSALNVSRIRQVEGTEGLMPYSFNVLESLDETLTNTRRVRMRPFINVEAKFLKWFKYNVMFQYEWSQNRSETYDDANTYLMRLTHNAMIDQDGECLLPSGGRYAQQTNNAYRYTFRNQLNFDKSFDNSKHNVNAIMGLEFRENKTPRLINQLLYGYNSTSLTAVRMDWASMYSTGWQSLVYDGKQTYGGLNPNQSETFHRYASFYANVGYNYRYRYNLTASIRWDEADLFGLDTKDQHHPLWSVGAGWNATEEDFMKGISWLNYLKLRLTYGVNGNVDQSSTTYFVARYKTVGTDPTNTQYLNYTDDNLPNPKLRWEKTSTFNVGVDFRLFNNILSGSLEYYNRIGDDLLVRKYLDPTVGATQRVINNGKMRNSGIELSLTGNIIRKGDWNFSASMNFAYNKNKLLKVEHSPTDIASNFIQAPTNYFIEGTSYNTLWAYHLDRVENGYPIIKDAEGNDMITFDQSGNPIINTKTMYGVDALVNCGTLTPKYNGSLSLNLRWKDLELNAMFVFAGGNKLRLDALDMSAYNITSNLINERWTPQNGEGRVRALSDIPNDLQTYASLMSGWWRYSDAHIKSADYIKLRNINVAYNLPQNICKQLHLGATRFTLQVSNLFTWCAAGHDIDPESYSPNSASRTLPQPTTYSLGLSTSF